MPIYKYKARDQDGKLIKKILNRSNIEAVETFLIKKQYTIIQIKEINPVCSSYTNYIKIPKKNIAIYCRQFSYLYSTGIPIITTLQTLEEQSENKNLKKQILFMTEEVMKGNSLSESMREYSKFPEFLINMTEVAELSGNLGEIYEKMADYYEREVSIEDTIKNAFIYPAILSIMIILGTIIAMIYLIPTYAAIYASQSVDLPKLTDFLIQASVFFMTYTLHIFIACVLLIILFLILMQTEKCIYYRDKCLVHVPVIRTIYMKIVHNRFANVLNILLESGFPIVGSIPIIKKVVNNRFLDSLWDDITIQTEKGTSIGEAIEKCNIFEPILYRMLRVGEESGKITDSLKKCVQYFDRDIESKIKNISKIIEPTLLIIIGSILGFVMLAVMLPAFNLNTVL